MYVRKPSISGIVTGLPNNLVMKAKGRPTKRYKSSVEDNQNISSSAVAKSNEGFLKTCSYCLGRGHNIRGCASKHKADKKMLISI
ncbi:unnamed protein product [Rhizophagus irregularis]|nr:unnamed protein product [Rhizophagus irregularis]